MLPLKNKMFWGEDVWDIDKKNVISITMFSHNFSHSFFKSDHKENITYVLLNWNVRPANTASPFLEVKQSFYNNINNNNY